MIPPKDLDLRQRSGSRPAFRGSGGAEFDQEIIDRAKLCLRLVVEFADVDTFIRGRRTSSCRRRGDAPKVDADLA
jgi:hypothetical protein